MLTPVKPFPEPVTLPVKLPVTLPTKLVAVIIPVILTPLGFTLSIDDPVDTTVNWPGVGEKNPVWTSPAKYKLGDIADPAENATPTNVASIPVLNGAASTQYASVPYPTTTSS